MREIVLDTETTGFDPKKGHRLVEIGCVELKNHLPTGEIYHQYINPERDMPEGAFNVHGLSEEFLSDYPVFADVADDFISFIGDSPLVIHNANFDMTFINYELKQLKYKQVPMTQAIDTLLIAREKFPGSPASLDALCKRFKVDNSSRTYHGALLDSELLAEVYLELLGGRQHVFEIENNQSDDSSGDRLIDLNDVKASGNVLPMRNFPLSDAEKSAHEKMIKQIKNPLWKSVNLSK